MSSPYQVLDNRPLDQWKVTELKEELRRRRLTISGLKQDLVQRLDEAVRSEREEVAKKASTIPVSDFLPVDRAKEAKPVAAESEQTLISHGGNGSERIGDVKVQIDINDSATDLGQEELQQGDKEEDLSVFTVKTSVTVTESVLAYTNVPKQEMPTAEAKSLNEKSVPQLENEDCKSKIVNEHLNPQLATEGTRALPISDMRDSTAEVDQVSEVGPNLGFQVDSSSSDSLSINEKIEVKDNIIADNAKLELDLVKRETVEPSSSNVISDSGQSHPMDAEEPLENKLSVEEKNDGETANAEMSKDNDIVDLGYSEKLNFDRSSGDDSIEEDMPESKHVDSHSDSVDVGDRSGKNKISAEDEENPVDIVGHDNTEEKKDIVVEKKNHLPSEKRKLDDEAVAANNQPVKRQRKWNTRTINISEPQCSGLASASAPKETLQVVTPKRSVSRFDPKGIEDSPGERIVPPPQKPATNSLRIDNFVRPFTLKAVQELLGKTGTVTSFWMDHIKTHCYVMYTSAAEAIATRDAVYNLRWPPYGGQLLVAEFVDPGEVKLRVEAPSQVPAPTPLSTGTSVPKVPPSQSQPSPHQKVSRQPVIPAHALPPPPPLPNPLPMKERINLPPPPPLPEKVDPPIVTLDDLFQKTKATPRIYYLPLLEEQVAAKLKGRGKDSRL